MLDFPTINELWWVVGSGDGDSFQCRGVLLLWHIVGQGPAVRAADARWVGCFFLFCFVLLFFLLHIFVSSRLSYMYLPFSNVSSVGRRLDILK